MITLLFQRPDTLFRRRIKLTEIHIGERKTKLATNNDDQMLQQALGEPHPTLQVMLTSLLTPCYINLHFCLTYLGDSMGKFHHWEPGARSAWVIQRHRPSSSLSHARSISIWMTPP
jgi:hypothetical protein